MSNTRLQVTGMPKDITTSLAYVFAHRHGEIVYASGRSINPHYKSDLSVHTFLVSDALDLCEYFVEVWHPGDGVLRAVFSRDDKGMIAMPQKMTPTHIDAEPFGPMKWRWYNDYVVKQLRKGAP